MWGLVISSIILWVLLFFLFFLWLLCDKKKFDKKTFGIKNFYFVGVLVVALFIILIIASFTYDPINGEDAFVWTGWVVFVLSLGFFLLNKYDPCGQPTGTTGTTGSNKNPAYNGLRELRFDVT